MNRPSQKTDFVKNQVLPSRVKQQFDHLGDVRAVHHAFMHRRALAMKLMEDVINSAGGMLDEKSDSIALFSRDLLEEFAIGSIEKCFGEEYKELTRRKYPRIPNSHLLCMTRIIDIKGKRFDFTPGSEITAEIDISGQEWFYQQNTDSFLPVPVLMEIGLQPCGFLSAYLGSILTLPKEDFYFRNLDGEATLENNIDVRGKILRTKATLISSVSNGSSVIQRFSFAVTCDGESMFHGNSVFGYFSRDALDQQSGFDSGKSTALVAVGLPANNNKRVKDISLPGIRANLKPIIPSGLLRMVDRIQLMTEEDLVDEIHASRFVYPSDWYFACHFYQDPVMPGSLGVEGVYQALIAVLYSRGWMGDKEIDSIVPDIQIPLSWKYRGQILPETREFKVVIKNIKVETNPDSSTRVTADADVRADAKRVYEIKKIAVRIIYK